MFVLPQPRYKLLGTNNNNDVNISSEIRSDSLMHGAFCDFIEAYRYEYEVIAKASLMGTEDVPACTEQDKPRQFVGRFASWRLEREKEEAERGTITYTDSRHGC